VGFAVGGTAVRGGQRELVKCDFGRGFEMAVIFVLHLDSGAGSGGVGCAPGSGARGRGRGRGGGDGVGFAAEGTAVRGIREASA
jgi:hypothetical protein